MDGTGHKAAVEAADIERVLVWAYRDQRAGAGEAERDGAAPGHAVSGMPFIEWVGRLGCIPDGRGGAWPTHPDTDHIVRAVNGLPDAARLLVARHALAGTRPEWRVVSRLRAVAVASGRGPKRAVAQFWWPRNHKTPAGCRVAFAGERAESVLFRRAGWSVWRLGLLALREELEAGGKLVRWRLSGPEAPEAPWLATPQLAAEHAALERVASWEPDGRLAAGRDDPNNPALDRWEFLT